jgi:hypothetical protein
MVPSLRWDDRRNDGWDDALRHFVLFVPFVVKVSLYQSLVTFPS